MFPHSMHNPNTTMTDTERQSAPTGAQDSASEPNADRPLGGAACSLSSFSGDAVAQLMEDLDGILCPTGYARCREVGSSELTSKEHRLFRMDFGHFHIDISIRRENPIPRAIAFSGYGCTPDEFLRKLRSGTNSRHRPHEGGSTVHKEFTKYARGICEGFVGLSEDDPPPKGIPLSKDFGNLE